jgi:uncharacterized cupredoxin-like copper-binding protein
MRVFGLRLLTLVALTAFVASAYAAVASTTVTVQLIDKVPDAPMATGLTYGTPGIDLTKATQVIRVSRTSAPAGDVAFNVTNTSKDMIHEMLVVPVPVPDTPLPYLADKFSLDESKINSAGEVSELDPGKSGSLTVKLRPGTYLLVCNQPGHYEAGMWTTFTVTK